MLLGCCGSVPDKEMMIMTTKRMTMLEVMSPDDIVKKFVFLVRPDRFRSYRTQSGTGYAQVWYASPDVLLKISRQYEIVDDSGYSCSAHLVDPKNDRRWCNFILAVWHLGGERVVGDGSIETLVVHVEKFIDMVLKEIRAGKKIPYY